MNSGILNATDAMWGRRGGGGWKALTQRIKQTERVPNIRFLHTPHLSADTSGSKENSVRKA
jgi:hypothetical protein